MKMEASCLSSSQTLVPNSSAAPIFSSSSFNPSRPYSSHLHPHPSFLRFPSKPFTPPFLCYASSPSPNSDPPPEKHPLSAQDLEATLNRLQDKVQIFFAVLFWMSLFFWTCASDGNGDGRPNKGSRFRR